MIELLEHPLAPVCIAFVGAVGISTRILFAELVDAIHEPTSQARRRVAIR